MVSVAESPASDPALDWEAVLESIRWLALAVAVEDTPCPQQLTLEEQEQEQGALPDQA